MRIGELSGSTTCSIKTVRRLVFLKAFRRDLFVAASMFLNIGPAFGQAGPFGSYEAFPRSTKLVLVMWAGRIEIIPILVMLRRSFWTGG